MFYITKAGWIAVNHRLYFRLFQIGYYSIYIIVQSVCTLKEKRPCAVNDIGTMRQVAKSATVALLWLQIILET